MISPDALTPVIAKRGSRRAVRTSVAPRRTSTGGPPEGGKARGHLRRLRAGQGAAVRFRREREYRAVRRGVSLHSQRGPAPGPPWCAAERARMPSGNAEIRLVMVDPSRCVGGSWGILVQHCRNCACTFR